ncbi:hypothetical protein [Reichenbachiella ulvae]|uniref:Glycoside hydrolase family 57 N-terminal domain-containing protein n=1 Tax=Reichenbachiella ulvae TaxID=2980104 RepID=A0ABT3CVK8_9BACT|nr:hypothetical protein [Reichenbachiella ulvae]MCV9387593.1 hypothetical protein [Reichenbachiella ulvae]
MTKKLSIILTFDFAHSLEPFSLFDIGQGKAYFNIDQSDENFMIDYQGYLENELDDLVALCKKDKLPISVYFSLPFLDMLEKHASRILTKLKEAIKQGSLSLLGGTANHGLSSIYSTTHFKEEIQHHTKRLEKLFGTKPESFYNTENLYCNEITETLLDLQFQSLFAGTIEWYLWKDKQKRVFHTTSDKSQKVFLLDNDEGASLFSENDRNTHFLQFGLEEMRRLGGIESIVKKATKKADLISLKEQVSETGDTTVYNIKAPVMGSTHGLTLESFHGNALQNRSLKEYFALEEKVRKSKDKGLIQDWARLGHIAYLLKMNKDEEQHILPYDFYNYYMNILNDLSLKA